MPFLLSRMVLVKQEKLPKLIRVQSMELITNAFLPMQFKTHYSISLNNKFEPENTLSNCCRLLDILECNTRKKIIIQFLSNITSPPQKKKSTNLWFSDVFWGFKKRKLGRNYLKVEYFYEHRNTN